MAANGELAPEKVLNLSFARQVKAELEKQMSIR